MHADLWRGYSRLDSEEGRNYSLRTVNHNQFFKVPITRVDTNIIEGIWNGVKTSILPRCRTKAITLHLFEYLWKKANKITFGKSSFNF